MDYQTPINKMSMVEFGAKAITRNVTSDYKSYTAGADGIYSQVNLATLPSNVFDYNQNIWSTYGSYTLTTKNKWSIKAGARYEHTDISIRGVSAKFQYVEDI
jgi:hypothetical protein